jgi:hypothetical protein
MDPERWKRVARLYESALERDPTTREAFLIEATGGDVALRREVESLLAQDATPVVIDRPVLEAAAIVLESGVFLEPGHQLGPYRIERPIGAGGMGEVYQARDTRLNRTVAIKEIHLGTRFKISEMSHLPDVHDVLVGFRESLTFSCLFRASKRGQVWVQVSATSRTVISPRYSPRPS